jgi:hypothetical protein
MIVCQPEKQAMTWALRVVKGRDAGQRVPLAEGATLLIGRGEDCGLRLSDPSASRVHCKVLGSGGKVFVEDAGSRWGTLVNNAAIETRELRPGDHIVIGDTDLQLEVDAPDAATLPPARIQSPQAANPRTNVVEPAAPRRPFNPAKLVGERFLRYRLGSIIARTRSGAVFRAFDSGRSTALGAETAERVIALKVFAPEVFAGEQAMRRFVRAIRTMLPLQHDNLVKLHTAGRWQGLCFASLEFVDGPSVTQLIQRVGIAQMLDWRRAWQIAVGVGSALQYAHERGIVHRNVTPGHILVEERTGLVKLGDLMLAKAMDECGECVTRAGEILGDVRYLAPEQLAGETQIDGRADLYSLGATLYAVLTGRPPFDGISARDIIQAVLAGDPPPPSAQQIGIPAAFESVVLRLLSRSPEQRYSSAGELLRELERVRKYSFPGESH